MDCLEDLLFYCNEKGYDISGIMINTNDLVFEERVKMNCFYCGKYNNSWRCPPKIPSINVEKMLSEFDSAAFIYLKKTYAKDYDVVRKESSVELHRALLECEKYLWKNNNSTALSFIGGSCKLCKNGCSPNGCANPYQSRSPVEALGINVVKSMCKYGVNVNFPSKEYIIRIGLLLW